MTHTFPISAKGLMPHQTPMRLIDAVLSLGDNGSGTAEALITADNIFLDQYGRLAPEALVELMAQAFAAVSGLRDRLAGGPAMTGYLVGVKHGDFSGQCKIGDHLRIDVRPTGDFGGFVLVAGEVYCRERLLARAELKIWVAPASEPPREAL